MKVVYYFFVGKKNEQHSDGYADGDTGDGGVYRVHAPKSKGDSGG
jgi:hypothetical protein